MLNKNDIANLRDLAKQVAEISQKDFQKELRNLWSRHNSLIRTRPLVLANVGRYDCFEYEILTDEKLKCEDPFFRQFEFELRHSIFKNYIGDDYIIEPWITVNAEYLKVGWGPEIKHDVSFKAGGAYKLVPVIKEPEDINKLVIPQHAINEDKTAGDAAKLQDAIGDILEVNIDRGTAYRDFMADISYSLVQMIGMEELMLYMYDRPEWLHEILTFMRDGILKVHGEAEAVGDWHLCDGCSSAMPYAQDIPAPKANSESVKRNQLWAFFASQEYALISPELYYEFLLQYQIPIMEKFGLIEYGCCEDLTKKIPYLRKIKNLRRIAVSPWADVSKCAEQIQQDYVFSWRPNPSTTICNGLDPYYVRKTVKDAMEASKGCHVDITLKDVQTVQNDPERIKEWVKIVREVSDNYV